VSDESSPAVPARPAAPASGRSGLALTAMVAATVVLVDQLSKAWALNALEGGRVIDVVWTLRFNLAFNSGMAFSQAQGAGPILGVIALVVIVVLLVSVGRSGGRLGAVATGLVIGGALGNVIDRLFRSGSGFLRGEVVDFIDLQWWPVFNVADMAITVGGVLLIGTAWFGDGRSTARAASASTPGEG
jgi:signal peptidase II